MATLATATAFEDDVLDAMQTVEDALLRSLRAVIDGLEPLLKLLPEPPYGELVPAPAEMVKHVFVFINKVVANQRDFATKLVELLPAKAVGPVPTVKPAPKAQAA